MIVDIPLAVRNTTAAARAASTNAGRAAFLLTVLVILFADELEQPDPNHG